MNCRNYVVDYVPLALVPVSLWRDGTLDLDVYRNYYESLPEGQRYAFTESGGHLYPMKPVFVSFLALPFYLPPLLAGVPTQAVDFWVGWGRVVAGILAGLAVSLSYVSVRRWSTDAAAVALTLLLAFGTAVWTTVGQILNYHLGAFVCVSALVLALRKFPLRPWRAGWIGLIAGAAVGMRPTTVVLLLPLGLYLCLPSSLPGWKSRLSALVGVLIVPLLNALLNFRMFGSWHATGYLAHEVDRWSTPLGEGALGLLVAPNSGLLVQSPFTILALVGGWVAWTTPGVRQRGLLCAYTLCFVAYWLLFARWHDWQGGLAFSSRMLSEGYALWLPLAAVGWGRVRRYPGAVPLLMAAGAWSVLYEVTGVALFDAISTSNPPHLSWQPQHNFFLLHVHQFGLLPTLGAIAFTAGELCLSAVGTLFVLAPFFLPPVGQEPQESCSPSPDSPAAAFRE